MIEDLIATGQKNNKYKNLSGFKAINNNGVLGFQITASGKLKGTNGASIATGKD